MCRQGLVAAGAALLLVFAGATAAIGQPPDAEKRVIKKALQGPPEGDKPVIMKVPQALPEGGKLVIMQGALAPSEGGKYVVVTKSPQGPPDEEKEILKEIKEAYKAPFEVHEDVLQALRKSYQQPSPDREAKIFRELRRMYDLNERQEAAILLEIRKAYQFQSAEQEERLFQEIQKAARLPTGAVPVSIQADQTRKVFRKFDVNSDGVLSSEELPEVMRGERVRWDVNRDGMIDEAEYAAYYQGRLQRLSEQVAVGEIDLKLGRMGPVVNSTASVSSTAPRAEEPRPTVFRAGKLPPGLPAWFAQLDMDQDGQVGLYEWKESSRPLKEFAGLDRNDDGFITPQEMLYYVGQQARPASEGDRAPANRPDSR